MARHESVQSPEGENRKKSNALLARLISTFSVTQNSADPYCMPCDGRDTRKM